LTCKFFSFTVSFHVTKHEVQTAALLKHKSMVKIYRYKEDNYQTTEVIRHTHALNSARKLKCSLNQIAVKPAVSFNAVPGYCSTGSKYNVYESVEWSKLLYVEDIMADYLFYRRLLKWYHYTLVWELII